MPKLSREDAKKAGYTHVATHINDGGKPPKKGDISNSEGSNYPKKGDTVLCKYNEKTGEYDTGGLCCLLGPDENYTLEAL
tara:strand:+ start:6345 stop:6584 length:240 start_codon:yes stop_codon:yes gene_type:complete